MINLLYMCILGPFEIKNCIYNVMSSSRELANYCQESVKSLQSNKISEALNNFHLKTSVDFVIKSLTDEDKLFFEFNDFGFDKPQGTQNMPIYNKVIDYMETYLLESNL